MQDHEKCRHSKALETKNYVYVIFIVEITYTTGWQLLILFIFGASMNKGKEFVIKAILLVNNYYLKIKQKKNRNNLKEKKSISRKRIQIV